MKKVSKVLAVLAGIAAMGLASCGAKTYEIAVVTDIGSLKDGGFNEGTYNGAKEFAKENKLTMQYYQPANGSNASDNDRVNAYRQAIANGAKVCVAPGFLQQASMETAAKESPDVKFVFVDGWNFGLSNVTAVTYAEQESGYMAGYAAVKEGYMRLGGTFGGGGSNPACNRFCYGYAQGINDAAKSMGKNVELKLSFKYGESFSASNELQTQISSWYTGGTEIVFACGGSMVNSVLAAANSTADGKIIGVDVDQSDLSTRVLTSAVKGLAPSVKLILEKIYAGKWDSELSDKTVNLGAADNATGLPTDDSSWRFKTFTKSEYDALFLNIQKGKIVPLTPLVGDVNDSLYWAAIDLLLTNVTINFEK